MPHLKNERKEKSKNLYEILTCAGMFTLIHTTIKILLTFALGSLLVEDISWSALCHQVPSIGAQYFNKVIFLYII